MRTTGNDTLPVGEPVSIIRQVRTNKNLTLKEFANLARCSDQVVMRAEQGIYSNIPPAVAYALSEMRGYTIEELNAHYKLFIEKHRQWAQNKKPLLPAKLELAPLDTEEGLHPFIWWRHRCGYTTRMGFCTAFCVHNSTLSRFEKAKTEYVPDIMYELFQDIFPGKSLATRVYSKLQRLYDEFTGKREAA